MLPPEQAAGQTTTATVDEKSGEVQDTLSQLDKLHGNDAGNKRKKVGILANFKTLIPLLLFYCRISL